LVVGIFFNNLQRGGRLAERISGQSPFLKALMNARGSPVICGFGNPDYRGRRRHWTPQDRAVSTAPPGAAITLRAVNQLAALFLGKRSPDADRSQ
jgi:hypothetical protein